MIDPENDENHREESTRLRARNKSKTQPKPTPDPTRFSETRPWRLVGSCYLSWLNHDELEHISRTMSQYLTVRFAALPCDDHRVQRCIVRMADEDHAALFRRNQQRVQATLLTFLTFFEIHSDVLQCSSISRVAEGCQMNLHSPTVRKNRSKLKKGTGFLMPRIGTGSIVPKRR